MPVMWLQKIRIRVQGDRKQRGKKNIWNKKWRSIPRTEGGVIEEEKKKFNGIAQIYGMVWYVNKATKNTYMHHEKTPMR